MTARKGRHFFYSVDILGTLAVLALLTAGFYLFNWDIRFQRIFYHGADGWFMSDLPVFRLVYHYGNYPALLLSVLGLLLFILSFSKPKLIKWRKLGIYFVLVMALGPGLLVNTILKDHWGRPRPRNTLEFGGKYAYEYPLEIDRTSTGKSFPCGHATMGFYFFTLAMVLRKQRRFSAILTGLLAGVYGCLIGLARIAQGGHYLSDVLWAGALVYLVSYMVYRIMNLDIALWYIPKIQVQKKLKTRHKVLIYILGLLIVFSVILATPYTSNMAKSVILEKTDKGYTKLEIRTSSTAIILDLRDRTGMIQESNGFGIPGSKTKYSVNSLPEENLSRISQRHTGIFTEIEDKLTVSLDTLAVRTLTLDNPKGTVTLDLSSYPRIPAFEISSSGSEFTLILPKAFNDSLQVTSHQRVQTFRKDVSITTMPSTHSIRIISGDLIIK